MGAWPMLDPGKMVHWVTVMQETPVADISGTSTVWSSFVSCWAQIDAIRGSDVLKSGQDTTQLFLTVKIRWQTGILPKMRVQTASGSTFIIQAVENIGERNVVLVLNCIALASNL